MKELEATLGRRVYEYKGSDGVTYYSFVRQEKTLGDPIRLRLRSRIGTHLVNFLTKMRQVGMALSSEDETDDAG